jgi:hypothetical protein
MTTLYRYRQLNNRNGGNGSPSAIKTAFNAWQDLMYKNVGGKTDGVAPVGSIPPFNDNQTSKIRLG